MALLSFRPGEDPSVECLGLPLFVGPLACWLWVPQGRAKAYTLVAPGE